LIGAGERHLASISTTIRAAVFSHPCHPCHPSSTIVVRHPRFFIRVLSVVRHPLAAGQGRIEIEDQSADGRRAGVFGRIQRFIAFRFADREQFLRAVRLRSEHFQFLRMAFQQQFQSEVAGAKTGSEPIGEDERDSGESPPSSSLAAASRGPLRRTADRSSSTSDWSGVLVRERRTTQLSRVGAVEGD
jgi:hypothetical protein